MELGQPPYPHHGPVAESPSGFSCPVSFRRGFDRPATSSSQSQLPEIFEEGGGGDKVHVAVGKSVEKALSLLRWTFKHFGCNEICILHVHQPSPLIPTLLGKLPASQANDEVVTAFRREEREREMKLLQNYLRACSRAKVNASIVMVEANEIHKGIVELVNNNGVRKLVMGAVPEDCMKVKKSSRKANYVAKCAPVFCEIRFINKGKNVWTRDASDGQSSLTSCRQLQIAPAEILSSRSFQNRENAELHEELAASPTLACSSNTCLPYNIHNSTSANSSSGSGYNSAEGKMSSDSDLNVEEQSLCRMLTEATLEAEASRDKAFAELLKRKSLESEAVNAINKAKAFELARGREVKLREEAEDALRTTIEEQQKLLEEKEEISGEISRAMRNIALLDSRAQEASRRFAEASGEVKQIQTSIATLQQEKQCIQRQKVEALRWIERWRNHRQAGAANCNALIGFVEELPKLAEFSLSDLQTATCNFSESFKIGQGGYGCVYKGEMLGRTVAIRKLHPHNLQEQAEFQQEVQVLGKLQHRHLVTLLGVCPEAWSLVYEYLSNSGGGDVGLEFQLPDEILSVIPSDPYDQLDLARKITSMAIASRVSKLESEMGKMRQKLQDKDRVVFELEERVSRLQHANHEAESRLRIALDENLKVSKERDSLALTTKKLSRDLAKLETFKRQLMQSLNDDSGSPAETVDIGTVPKAYPEKDEETNVYTGQYSSSGSTDKGATDEALKNSGQGFSMTPYITPRLTPTGTPKIISTSGSPRGYSAISSPQQSSGATSPQKPAYKERSSFSSWYSSSQQSSAANSPPRGRSHSGRTPRIDGKEFFRQARSRLSYEQFSAFLANIKELNAHKQTREETLRKAEEIFGNDNKDLYLSFQGLLSRNIH